jgi:hypothetical protein
MIEIDSYIYCSVLLLKFEKNAFIAKKVIMKKMSVTNFKTHFSDVLEQVRLGEKIVVTLGQRKEIVGYFLFELPPPTERKLGLLEGKAKVIFHPDFKISEDEFLKS